MAKNKNGKRVYENTRRECVKEFEKTLTIFQVNLDRIVHLLEEAEDLVSSIEDERTGRKEVANKLESVYEQLRSRFNGHDENVEDFGICIDQLTHTK
jgi:predicted nuclease with TOPRIM domain